MSSTSRVAVLAAAVLLSSCATISHTFTCPAQGGAEWRELRSEHVLLQTDLSQARAEELLRDAEQMRALVLAALSKQPPLLPDRIHLVALRTDRELWEFTGEQGLNDPRGTFAFLVERTSADPLLAVAPAWGKDRNAYEAGLTHAIAWQVSSHLFPAQPAWHRVGLATYMETLARDDDGLRNVVGTLPRLIIAPPRETADSLARALSGDSAPYGEWGLRSPGWMLVRWLSEARSVEYMAFLRQLSTGVEGKTAWKATFPQLDPKRPDQMAALEAELTAFFAIGRLRYREVNASVAPTWTTRPLATPDVHELRIRVRRGSMALRATKDREIAWKESSAMDQATGLKARLEAQSAVEAAEALREAPLHPAALRAVSAEKAIDPATARASTGAYPDDWRAWLLLGEALQGGDPQGAGSAFRKVDELAPGEPFALLGMARGLLAIDEAPLALPKAREVVRLAPFSDQALAVLAAAAARTGDCPEALASARRLRARRNAGDDPLADQLLEQVASRCPAAAPTAMH